MCRVFFVCFLGYFWREKNADADGRKNSSLVCIADALFSVSSLGRFRHRSPQEPVVFTSQQTGWKRMIAKSGDGHTSTSGSSFTVCNPQQTLSGLSIVPTAQCAVIPLPPVTLSLSSI